MNSLRISPAEEICLQVDFPTIEYSREFCCIVLDKAIPTPIPERFNFLLHYVSQMNELFYVRREGCNQNHAPPSQLTFYETVYKQFELIKTLDQGNINHNTQNFLRTIKSFHIKCSTNGSVTNILSRIIINKSQLANTRV